MHGSTCQPNYSGEGGYYYPLPLLGAKAPVPLSISLVVLLFILLVLIGVGVGSVGNPLPQLSHDFVRIIAPGGDRIYKTGQEQTLGNHLFPPS